MCFDFFGFLGSKLACWILDTFVSEPVIQTPKWAQSEKAYLEFSMFISEQPSRTFKSFMILRYSHTSLDDSEVPENVYLKTYGV